MASARFSLLPLLLPLHLPLPSPYPPRHECWCAACERRIERRLADLYVDSLEAADYATFLLDLLWKVTGGHPDGAI